MKTYIFIVLLALANICYTQTHDESATKHKYIRLNRDGTIAFKGQRVSVYRNEILPIIDDSPNWGVWARFFNDPVKILYNKIKYEKLPDVEMIDLNHDKKRFEIVKRTGKSGEEYIHFDVSSIKQYNQKIFVATLNKMDFVKFESKVTFDADLNKIGDYFRIIVPGYASIFYETDKIPEEPKFKINDFNIYYTHDGKLMFAVHKKTHQVYSYLPDNEEFNPGPQEGKFELEDNQILEVKNNIGTVYNEKMSMSKKQIFLIVVGILIIIFIVPWLVIWWISKVRRSNKNYKKEKDNEFYLTQKEKIHTQNTVTQDLMTNNEMLINSLSNIIKKKFKSLEELLHEVNDKLSFVQSSVNRIQKDFEDKRENFIIIKKENEKLKKQLDELRREKVKMELERSFSDYVIKLENYQDILNKNSPLFNKFKNIEMKLQSFHNKYLKENQEKKIFEVVSQILSMYYFRKEKTEFDRFLQILHRMEGTGIIADPKLVEAIKKQKSEIIKLHRIEEYFIKFYIQYLSALFICLEELSNLDKFLNGVSQVNEIDYFKKLKFELKSTISQNLGMDLNDVEILNNKWGDKPNLKEDTTRPWRPLYNDIAPKYGKDIIIEVTQYGFYLKKENQSINTKVILKR